MITFRHFKLWHLPAHIIMDTEKKLKQEIIKSAETVKKKVKQMRNMKMDTDNALETVLKPITRPLNQLANNSNIFDRVEEEQITPKFENTMKSIKSNEPSGTNESNSNFQNHYYRSIEKDEISQSNSDDSEIHENNTETDCDATILSDNEDAISLDSTLPRRFSTPVSHSPKEFNAIPFGVRSERGKLMMGSSRIHISDNNVKVGSTVYKKTRGLNDLLFKKTPNLKVITDEDKYNYKLILQETNAHRRDFNPKKPIKSNKGLKYLRIIKPLFKFSEKCQSTESLPIGSGFVLPTMKTVKPRVDYIYWDNPNELVDRLKLLIASKQAGNTGLDNEIIAIIEELRENGNLN